MKLKLEIAPLVVAHSLYFSKQFFHSRAREFARRSAIGRDEINVGIRRDAISIHPYANVYEEEASSLGRRARARARDN